VTLWDFAARALCALRGIAAVSRPSVCSPSVTLRYRLLKIIIINRHMTKLLANIKWEFFWDTV